MMDPAPNQPNVPTGADALTPDQRAQLQQHIAALAAAFPRMPLLRMVAWLFLYPRKALLCARINRQWGRALLLILITALAFAIVDNLRTLDTRRTFAAQRNKDILEAFSKTVPQVSYLPDSKKFTWGDDTSAVPRFADMQTVRLDVVTASQEVTDMAIQEYPQTFGFILSNYEIVFWLKSQGPDSVVVRQNQTAPLATLLLDQEKKNNSLVLSGQVFMDDVLKPLLATYDNLEGIGMILIMLLSHFGDAFSLFLYAFVLMFFLRKLDHAAFGATFSTAMAFIFPPMLLGNLFLTLLPESKLEDSTVFIIAYFAYLILVCLDRSIQFRHVKH